jgi:hypothetical protein
VDFEHESGDEKDDSEDDHGVYLISMRMEGKGSAGSDLAAAVVGVCQPGWQVSV